MNYEQMYKAALERAKDGKPIDEIFPELKESEDERIRKEIITYLSNERNGATQLTPRTNQYEKWIAWLKKQGEQKPAWSEEDERIYRTLIHDAVESNLALTNTQKRWLKSLKPQPHWKPSDEQMSALKRCCDGWQDNADGRLESLYNDLKKLKESKI